MVSLYSTDSFISPDGLSKNLVLNRSLMSLDGNIRSVVSGFVHPGHESIQMAEECARRHQLPNDQRGLDRALYPFISFPRHYFDRSPGEWHFYKPFQPQRVHLFLMAEAADLTKQSSWAQVLAVAQICVDGSSLYREGLASLCCHVSQVFTLQPTRLYVHALYIRGSTLELWVFDRAGMYCADTFNIHADPVRYVALVLGYTLMDSEALGSFNVIRVDTTKADYTRTTFVPKSKHSDSPTVAIPVRDTPFVRVMGIVGSGMVCYHAQDYSEEPHRVLKPNRVLKLKWRVTDDMPEEGPLQKARNRGVWGVVRLDHHGELQDTAELRKGIEFGPPLKLIVRQWGDALDRNNSGFKSHTESAGKDDGIPHRVLCFHVLSPLGRRLSTFQTREELLQALRDAIKGHRSLLQNARILHRDVSEDNIVIVDDTSVNSPKGILIDLDSALDLEAGPNRRQITGTRAFMSIGILRKHSHTYRHDLESFLYVFLSTVIANRNLDLPEDSKLHDWSQGTWQDSARKKAHFMEKSNFTYILDEFPEEHETLKPLAEDLRDILFPMEGDEIFTGTDLAAENRIYNGMIGAFEWAILQEKRRTN
ncbi:uncharacterized protein GGS22DRAFT_165863 [Annulohypoxylon maeteangense]|uniref:uncharacterized protein n=1 Tax=Annulohypoxylon maeteangense TaxID=1927788 RepID=UPI00200743BB|nr:uncharacterized protein GGS22DRAFT_165863 [Annulohypoxylon maeteangense]KAI0883699.1 hypothetical protein GGS22DRAFT_165863 [Annulohypoxylon maeteangense]